jgi:hypothetical protein
MFLIEFWSILTDFDIFIEILAKHVEQNRTILAKYEIFLNFEFLFLKKCHLPSIIKYVKICQNLSRINQKYRKNVF